MNQSTTTISRTSCVSVRRDPRGDAAGSHMSQAKGLQLLEGNISGDPTPTTPRRQVGPTFQSHILTRTPRLHLDSGADRWTPLCSRTQKTACQDYSGWMFPQVGDTIVYVFKQRKCFQLQSEISIVRTSLCILQTLGFFNLMVCHEMRF